MSNTERTLFSALILGHISLATFANKVGPMPRVHEILQEKGYRVVWVPSMEVVPVYRLTWTANLARIP